jgi:endoglucanase
MIKMTIDSRWLVRFACGALFGGLGGCAANTDGASASSEPSVTEAGDALRCDPTSSRELDPNTKFFVKSPEAGAVTQIKQLLKSKKYADAARLTAMEATPQAAWFTEGTPSEVKSWVKDTMADAARVHRVPTLVAYNLPYRDCAQYSAGGATDSAAYKAWIDGFAKGIGSGKAVVILEPDGLGLIPYNTTIYGVEEWCKPTVTDSDGNQVPAPGATADERYALLQYAVQSILEKAPSASVYIDGSHSFWLGVGEAAHRIYRAGFREGVQQVQGFFLNVSNYQPTQELEQFGTWVSMCLAAGTPGVGPDWMRDADTAAPHFDWCRSQYDDAGVAHYTPEFAAEVTAALEGLMDGAAPQVKFVVDTGRNGVGAWTPDPNAGYPDAQTWCNAPHRGLGLRPTVSTTSPLASAYLWVKTPGGSDGSCNRGIAGGTTDPEWGGIVDPIAGDWFPEQALELARLASPPLF